MKVLMAILSTCLLLVFWSCDDNLPKRGELVDFIPENPDVVFRVNNLDDLSSDLTNNSFVASFKKTKAYDYIAMDNPIFTHLDPASESVISIKTDAAKNTNYVFATLLHESLFIPDSIPNKTIETLSYGNISLQRTEIENAYAFSAIKDSIFVVSSSQKLLQDILDNKTEKDPELKKLFTINKESNLAAIAQARAISFNDSTRVNFSSWGGLQLQLFPDGITATGVVLAQDSVPQILSVFEGQIPQQNDIELITPREIISATSFTFSDSELLVEKLKPFREDSLPPQANGLFESINEIGVVTLSSGKAVVLKSIDPELTQEALAQFISQEETFREVMLHGFSASELFEKTFGVLIPRAAYATSFQIENFFVFAETEGIAQQIITAYRNNDCINKTPYFDGVNAELSNASSLLILKSKGEIAPAMSTFFGEHMAEELKAMELKKFPLAALQFSYDRNFAHVNLVCKEASEKQQLTGSVVQQFSISLDNPILGNPVFFSNHRTRGKDIVVQDIKNKIYLIASSGKILWEKQLDGPLLGGFNEVDLLRNGRKQLAFNTSKTVYVVDRNGKEVKPFPMKFKDDITQPLSVFDYDNKRNYRFVVTQGTDIFMYDSKAKPVKGFTFKSTKTNIVLPPKHIRLGTKDYILLAEESGRLNILSRVGKTRINVDHQFDFSEIAVQKEGSQFVVITKDNIKKTISQSGKVTSLKLDVSGTYGFAIKGQTKVTLDDNLLRINGNLVELPFGIYTAPQLFTVNRKTYITLTETQEKKVYVVTRSGEIVSGFPIYGSHIATLGDAKNNKKLHVVTKGDTNEVILYAIQ